MNLLEREHIIRIRIILVETLLYVSGSFKDASVIERAADLFSEFRSGHLRSRVFETAFYSAKAALSHLMEYDEDEYSGGSVWYVTECIILNLGLAQEEQKMPMDEEGRYVVKFLRHIINILTEELRCKFTVVYKQVG